MKTVLVRFLPYGAVLAVIFAIWSMWQTINTQSQALEMHQELMDKMVQNIDQVIDQNRQNAVGMEDLLRAQQNVSRTLSSRTIEIRRLQSEVEEIRSWADQPLPDDIVRMRSRPTIVGADGYSAAVPSGGAVSVDRSTSDEQR